MSDRARVDIRIRLVEGHWALGEYGEAQTALERALDEDLSHPGLRPLVFRLQGAVDSGHAPGELREALAHLAHRLGGSEPLNLRSEGGAAGTEVPPPVISESVEEEDERAAAPCDAAEPASEVDELEGPPLEAEEPPWEVDEIEAPPAIGAECPREVDELERPSPLATSTMAELFFEQGLHDRAMQVAGDVLRRNPDDQRAQRLLARLSRPTEPPDPRIVVLERWLSRVRRRRAERGVHP